MAKAKGFDQDKAEVSEDSSALVPSALVNESEFKQEAITLVDTARSIVVNSQQSYEVVVEFGKTVSSFRSKVEEFFAPLKAAAHAAHKVLCDKEKEILRIPNQADEIAKSSAREWKADQKRIEDQRLKIEQARLQREAEENRKRLLAELKKTGNKAAVAQAKSEPLIIPQAQVTSLVQKVAGTRNRTVYHFRIDNAELIPDGVGDLFQFWIPNEKGIRDYVSTMKEQTLPGGAHAIPGITVWETFEVDW